jgi:hypothetical protein
MPSNRRGHRIAAPPRKTTARSEEAPAQGEVFYGLPSQSFAGSQTPKKSRCEQLRVGGAEIEAASCLEHLRERSVCSGPDIPFPSRRAAESHEARTQQDEVVGLTVSIRIKGCVRERAGKRGTARVGGDGTGMVGVGGGGSAGGDGAGGSGALGDCDGGAEQTILAESAVPRAQEDEALEDAALEEEIQFRTEGSDYIGKKVRRYIFNPRGKICDAADGVVVGWLSKEESQFETEDSTEQQPIYAPLWHMKYDDTRLGEEDLEEHEVEEAVELMAQPVPKRAQVKYQKRLELLAVQETEKKEVRAFVEYAVCLYTHDRLLKFWSSHVCCVSVFHSINEYIAATLSFRVNKKKEILVVSCLLCVCV